MPREMPTAGCEVGYAGNYLRSRQPKTGVDTNHQEKWFVTRHHPLTSVEVSSDAQRRSGKKRQMAAMNLPLFVAFGHWQLSQFAVFCRFRFNTIKRLSTRFNVSRPRRRNHPLN
jgi:hypothetical protein